MHFFLFQRVIRKPRAKKQEEYDSDDPDPEAEAIPDKVFVCLFV